MLLVAIGDDNPQYMNMLLLGDLVGLRGCQIVGGNNENQLTGLLMIIVEIILGNLTSLHRYTCSLEKAPDIVDHEDVINLWNLFFGSVNVKADA